MQYYNKIGMPRAMLGQAGIPSHCFYRFTNIKTFYAPTFIIGNILYIFNEISYLSIIYENKMINCQPLIKELVFAL